MGEDKKKRQQAEGRTRRRDSKQGGGQEEETASRGEDKKLTKLKSSRNCKEKCRRSREG